MFISNALRSVVTSQVEQPSVAQPAPEPAVLRPEDSFDVQQVQARQPSAAEREVAGKIDALVQRKFGGDWKKAFQAYAGPDGQVDCNGIMKMLNDAGVGGLFMPQGMVADELMKKFDADRNGRVSWPEFSTSMRNLGFRV